MKDIAMAGHSQTKRYICRLGRLRGELTAMEAIIEHLNMERANVMKGGGAKLGRMAENMTELNCD